MTTFKCITGMAPKYLQDLISIKRNTQDNMQSNNTATMLHTPKVKYQTLQHGSSCILHQHYGTSYQNSLKIHQPWTSTQINIATQTEPITNVFCTVQGKTVLLSTVPHSTITNSFIIIIILEVCPTKGQLDQSTNILGHKMSLPGGTSNQRSTWQK